MGSSTRYWCDRCGFTVEFLEHVEIKRENAKDLRPTRKYLDLCAACCADVFAAINATMAEAGVS